MLGLVPGFKTWGNGIDLVVSNKNMVRDVLNRYLCFIGVFIYFWWRVNIVQSASSHFFRKGRHQGPQITYLQFCWFLVIFFFILAVINDFYWKDMYICIHFIKYTYLFHFPWRIYTSMCFSDATPGGGREKKEIGLTPPTPCEKKTRRMWPMGTRSMPMPMPMVLVQYKIAVFK